MTDLVMRPMRPRMDWLTARERVVLRHMQNGLSAEEISRADYVALSTVRSHIRNVLMKLGVNSQLAAVALANRELSCPDCRARHMHLPGETS